MCINLKLKKYIFRALILLALLNADLLFSFNYPFKIFSVESGLPDETVTRVIQDSKGYLWVGTFNGLCRFDGTEYINVNQTDDFRISTIAAIIEDSRGNIWVGSGDRTGLACYDGETWNYFPEQPELSNLYISAITEDSSGNLWFSALGAGVVKYDGKSWQIIPIEGVGEGVEITRVKYMQDGSLRFSSYLGPGVVDAENNKLIFEQVPDAARFMQIEEDLDGNVWYGSWGYGAFRYDGEQWMRFTVDDGLTSNTVFWVTCDSRGDVWAGTDNGISIFDGHSWQQIGTEHGLPSADIRAILEDREGNIWVGTGKSGLLRLTRHVSIFTMNDGLVHDVVNCILEDSKRRYWFGSYGGLTLYDNDQWRTYDTKDGLPGKVVLALEQDNRDRIWIGMQHGRLACIEDGRIREMHGVMPDGANITSMAITKDNTKWIGTSEHGIVKISGNAVKVISTKNGLKVNSIEKLFVDSNDVLWAGTSWGLQYYKNGTWIDYQAINGPKDICENRDGLWICTGSDSIFSCNDDIVTGHNFGEGYEGGYSQFINTVGDKIFIGTNLGLLVYQDEDFVLYNSSDWLPSNITNPQSGYVDSKNNLWFGTIRGLVKYDTKLDTHKKVPPNIEIVSVETLDDEKVALMSRLDYGQNYLKFVFKGLYLQNPQSLNYSYMLEGTDSYWRSTDLNTVQYINLAPGDYCFKVKAKSKEGDWSDNYAEFSFSIAPPVWQTWYFRLVLVLLVLGAGYMVLTFWYKRKSAGELEAKNVELNNYLQLLNKEIEERKLKEKEKNELQQQLARAQKMESLGILAGGVAHDLNNILTGIVSYPELLEMQIDGLLDQVAKGERDALVKDLKDFKKAVATIQKSGQRAADVVQDLLTMARRGVSSMKGLNLNNIVLKQLESPELSEMKNLKPNVAIEHRLDPDLLPILGSESHLIKTINNLLLNAFEAIESSGKIVIVTENTYIDRPIKGYDQVEEGDYNLLSISDDGVGIAGDDLNRIFEPFFSKKEVGRSGTGLGMAVVWGTVKDHNGYIDVISSEGKGTTIKIYFPIAHNLVLEERSKVSIDDYRGNGETVLLVDDAVEQRMIASRILTTLNYKVVLASSGQEALEFIRDSDFDIVILDMIMYPGMDGLDTYREIIKIKPGQRAFIVSGFAETNRVREAQKLGAGRYVRKPYTIESLGEALKEELLLHKDS